MSQSDFEKFLEECDAAQQNGYGCPDCKKLLAMVRVLLTDKDGQNLYILGEQLDKIARGEK